MGHDPNLGSCRSCKAVVIWATMKLTSKRNPLDPDPVTVVKAKAGIIAYNPATGAAQSVTAANILQTALWASRGVTFHLSHWATCPDREEHRKAADARP